MYITITASQPPNAGHKQKQSILLNLERVETIEPYAPLDGAERVLIRLSSGEKWVAYGGIEQWEATLDDAMLILSSGEEDTKKKGKGKTK